MQIQKMQIIVSDRRKIIWKLWLLMREMHMFLSSFLYVHSTLSSNAGIYMDSKS